MVKINLLPEKPEVEIWQNLEKVLWVLGFSLPFAIILWAKLAVHSK
jgi:hypothetical protein